VVWTEDGTMYNAHAVLIATGADYRRLNVRGKRNTSALASIFAPPVTVPFTGGQTNWSSLGRQQRGRRRKYS